MSSWNNSGNSQKVLEISGNFLIFLTFCAKCQISQMSFRENRSHFSEFLTTFLNLNYTFYHPSLSLLHRLFAAQHQQKTLLARRASVQLDKTSWRDRKSSSSALCFFFSPLRSLSTSQIVDEVEKKNHQISDRSELSQQSSLCICEKFAFGKKLIKLDNAFCCLQGCDLVWFDSEPVKLRSKVLQCSQVRAPKKKLLKTVRTNWHKFHLESWKTLFLCVFNCWVLRSCCWLIYC